MDHVYDFPTIPETSGIELVHKKKDKMITEVSNTDCSKTKQNVLFSAHYENTRIDDQKGSSDFDEENVYETVPDSLR